MEKAVVPQFVADYIESFYDGIVPEAWEQAELIKDWDFYIAGNPDVQEWVKDDSNFVTMVKAIVTNHYEVEVEEYIW